MIDIKSADLSAREAYKLISGSIIPRPIAWITTLDQTHNVINLAPFSFFSGVAGQAPLISVAILRFEDGQQKDTAKNLLTTGEGVVHLVSEALVEEMNLTSASLSADRSELTLTNLSTVDSQTVAVPGLKEAKIRFEVKVHQYVPVKDDQQATISDLFILKVIAMHFDESVIDIDKHYVLAEALQPVARLAGPEYANLGRKYRLQRPK